MIPDSLTMPAWQLYTLYAIYVGAVIVLAIAGWRYFSWPAQVTRMQRELDADLTPRERRIKAIAHAQDEVKGRFGRPTLVVVQFDKRGQRGDAA